MIASSTFSHLDTLPTELLHHIISYLLPTHDPNRSVLATPPPSPLLSVSLTSRTLLQAVESYSRTLLLQWSTVTKFDATTLIQSTGVVDLPGAITCEKIDRILPAKKHKKTTKKKTAAKSYRGVLLRWKDRNCVFCGKRSIRKAVLLTGFGCCQGCDKREWADKITKTNAKKEYHLSEEHLFPEPGDGWPIINYGSYTVEGGIATMFLRRDVERLAAAVHGDWKAHMAERMAKAEARRLRKEEARKSIGSTSSAGEEVIDLTIVNSDDVGSDG